MKTTVAKYTRSRPKAALSAKLKAKFGEKSQKEVFIGHGLVRGGRGYGYGGNQAATNAPQSNISRLLKRYNGRGYIVGGAAGRNARDGNWFAIYK